MKEEAIIIQI